MSKFISINLVSIVRLTIQWIYMADLAAILAKLKTIEIIDQLLIHLPKKICKLV